MTLLAASLALLATGYGGIGLQDPLQDDGSRPDKLLGLPTFDGEDPRCMLQVPGEKLKAAKISPKWKWEFEWCIAAMGRPTGAANFKPKFRVFEQQKKEVGDVGEQVARFAIRLWDMNFRRLKMEHNPHLNFGIIDFYLAFGGKAGGEQLVDEDRQEVAEGGAARKVNTIYIYAVQTFTDPVEMAREVAHEYGHASLPGVSGFEAPEAWANGYLGEKLYLKWARDMLAAKRLTKEDVMGADLADLDAWVKQRVDPLVLQGAQRGPSAVVNSGKDKAAMDSYLGLALYMESVLPPEVFAQSLKLMPSAMAADYPKSILLAIDQPDSYVFAVPRALANKPIWVPVGKGRIVGNASILKREGDWAQVKAGDSFRVVNRG